MKSNLAHRLSEAMSAFCRVNMQQRTSLPIRSSEMGVLIFVSLNAGENGVRPVELSDYFGIKKSSVSAIIASLEKEGYIARTASDNDKRSVHLLPTQKGTRLVEEAIEEHHRISNTLIEKIGSEKCEEFLKTLEAVTKIIQKGDVK